MHRVNMLKYFGVTPYMVFDGDFLPSKAGTEASREQRRQESRRLGMELLKAGKQSQAFGRGTMKFLDSHESYEGGWRDNKMHGRGVYRFANGSVFEGEWRDNAVWGEGTFTDENSKRQRGSNPKGEWLLRPVRRLVI